MGLLNASMFGILPMLLDQQGPQQGQAPPMMPPIMNPGGGIGGGMQPGMGGMSQQGAGDFLSAFQNNPQFMQQLQAIQNGQGPGSQPPQFTPPMTRMDTGVNGSSGGGRLPLRAYGQAGGQIDPLAFLRNSQF